MPAVMQAITERPAEQPELSFWLDKAETAPATARMLAAEYLTKNDPLLSDAQLLLSELVTNALHHGTPPTHRIYVRIRRAVGEILIEVHDRQADQVPTMSIRPEDSESGRGMRIVSAIAAEWGVKPRAAGFGKIVWCTIRDEGELS